MTELKCPICNKPMKQATYDYDKKDNDDTLYMSIMPCDCVCSYGASKAVWQELIRTRKALEGIKKVVDGFHWCDSNMYLPDYHDGLIIAEIVNEALEQKDVK